MSSSAHSLFSTWGVKYSDVGHSTSFLHTYYSILNVCTGPVVGSFNRLTFHELSGNVVFRGRRKLVVRDFVYDGDAPDAFFVAGTRPVAPGDRIDPSEPGAFALPVEEDEEKQREWNEDGLAVAYGDPDVPILREFDGHRVSAGKKPPSIRLRVPAFQLPAIEILASRLSTRPKSTPLYNQSQSSAIRY